MSDARVRTNTVVKGQPRMKKYVVEAPEPKPGQKLSSGGIRENGKMAVTYKNPVPLEDVRAEKNYIAPQKYYHNDKKSSDTKVYWELGKYFLGFFWKNFGEQVVGTWLQEKSYEVARVITCQSEQAIPQDNIIDVAEKDVEILPHEGARVVQFQSRIQKKGIQ